MPELIILGFAGFDGAALIAQLLLVVFLRLVYNIGRGGESGAGTDRKAMLLEPPWLSSKEYLHVVEQQPSKSSERKRVKART